MSYLLVLPLVFLYYAQCLVGKRHIIFQAHSQLLSMVPGRIGNQIRYWFYKMTINRLGSGTIISFGTTFTYPDIEIGERVYIGPNCHLALCDVGDDTLIATGICIISGMKQHGHARTDIPISMQGGVLERVTIGSGCWVGNNALIGSSVGCSSIVGSASVVTKAIPKNSIAVGNPAKVIKNRES